MHPNQGQNGLDSVQNGILLSTALHPFWDCHAFSIHPVYPFIVLR